MPDHNIRSYPLGYVESVIAKQNLIVDPSLHEFYDKVLLITRGPLVSWDRFVAIVKMNVGGYQHLIDGYNGRGAIKDLSEYIDEKHPVEGYDLVYCPDKFQQFELLCLDKD